MAFRRGIKRMKFGTTCILRRGGERIAGRGRGRYVRVRYLGATGHQVYCELLQDDFDACVEPFQKGGRGWWSKSALREIK